jgi:RNA polymerase sigma factor (sigma-70 family)
MPDIPSAELLVRYQAGDPRAASELFHRYEHRLHRLARSCLASRLARRVSPEDVVQSACRSFFRRARDGAFTLAQRGDLWRLLARITRHKVCRSARRHGADCRAVSREQPANPEYPDPSLDPAEVAALADELAAALIALPPTQQSAAELWLQGVPPHQIAARLGCSHRTVRRALDELRSELERRLLAPADDCAVLPYGDVVLRRLLGSGGMGQVYRAEYRPTGRPVAVKVLRKRLLSRPGLVACFRGEARVLSRLNHPGIVRVHGAGRLPDGGHFLAMDLIEGPDLGQILTAGPVPPELAARWVVAVAEAVEYAHRQGVIHCDLKPGNVLLQGGSAPGDLRSAVPKVVDFGLSRVLGPRGACSVGGTAGYMAPEQTGDSPEGVSAWTDVYGLGGLLYALLTGRPPAAGAERARPSVLRPEVPTGVEAVCLRCLEREPGRRFATAGEVAAALQGILIAAGGGRDDEREART